MTLTSFCQAVFLLLLACNFCGCSRRSDPVDSAPSSDNQIEAPQSAASDAVFAHMQPGPKAVLVGCTRYQNLGESATLHGPANDVELMKTLLTTQFEFPESNVIVLSEAEGGDRRPTFANIEKSLVHIARHVNEGEYVVFFFAGHGTQVPDQIPPDVKDPEPDGFDEVLLPCDAEKWDSKSNQLNNCIRDDQLNEWLKQLTARKAIPWVIIDACHSGTVVRSQVTETYRKIYPEALGIPEGELEAAAATATSNDVWSESAAFEVPEEIPELAALYAALPSEPTPEMVPPDGSDNRVYGLLTYTLYTTLSAARSPLSYGGLAQRIRSQYRAWGRMYPTPVAEGEHLEMEVLGRHKLAQSSPIRLRRDSGELKINAGTLYGYHSGTVFAVYPMPGDPDAEKPIGGIRITANRSDLFESSVEPFAITDLNLPALSISAPDGCPCRPVYIDYGDQILRVAIAENAHTQENVTDEQREAENLLRQQLSDALQTICSDNDSMIESVVDPQRADWVLQVRDGKPELASAKGWVSEFAKQSAPPRFGPVPTDGMHEWLRERFRRIAQATNLIGLAGKSADSDVQVSLHMLLHKDGSDQQGEVAPENKSMVLREGDIISFQAENLGATPIDVTMLFVDSGFGITTVFPRRSVLDNRLSSEHPVRTSRFPVNTSTTGIEHIVLVAVEAEGEPCSFGFLQQETIEQVASESNQNRGVDSPLGRLLKRAQYREGQTRGLTFGEFAKYAFVSVSWTVAAKEELQ